MSAADPSASNPDPARFRQAVLDAQWNQQAVQAVKATIDAIQGPAQGYDPNPLVDYTVADAQAQAQRYQLAQAIVAALPPRPIS